MYNNTVFYHYDIYFIFIFNSIINNFFYYCYDEDSNGFDSNFYENDDNDDVTTVPDENYYLKFNIYLHLVRFFK